MRRHRDGPILTREDIPDVPPRLTDATSVFNPGAIRVGEAYWLLLRVQARSRETFLMWARGNDGVRFEVEPRLVAIHGLGAVEERIHHVYDPRLCWLDGTCHVVFAADVDGACRLGVARSEDLRDFELIGFDSTADTRNGVLFPERIDGRYLRLERPNRVTVAGGPTSGDEIVLSESSDLIHWKRHASVLHGRPHYWDERIGSGPPPIKTRRGWLHLYHGVATHFQSTNIYQAGAVLLDRQDPARVLGRTWNNLLEPRELWELVGQVPNVVFPSGWIVEDVATDDCAADDSRVLVYYGAADTCVGLATTTIGALLEACEQNGS